MTNLLLPIETFEVDFTLPPGPTYDIGMKLLDQTWFQRADRWIRYDDDGEWYKEVLGLGWHNRTRRAQIVLFPSQLGLLNEILRGVTAFGGTQIRWCRAVI